MDQEVPIKPSADPKSLQLSFNPNYVSETRLKRSLNTNEESNAQLYDEIATKVKNYLFSSPKVSKERSAYNNVQDRIYSLMSQLGNYDNAYQPMPYHLTFKPKSGVDILESKSGDLVASILEKIVDGLIKALPRVLEKIFGKGLYELFNFNNGYKYESDYRSVYNYKNDIQNLFGNLGHFGYIPMVILKIIDGITTFMNILRKNTFFRTFLLPALVLLVITGSIIFLIWWFQADVHPDSEDTYSNYYSSQQIPVTTNSYLDGFHKYAHYDKRKLHYPRGYFHNYDNY